MSDRARLRRARSFATAALGWVFVSGCAACSGGPAPDRAASGLLADIVAPPAGVLDRGDDPAVVAIDAGGQVLCTGALIAPDVVLTARRCVAITAPLMQCPAAAPQVLAERDPRSLRFLVGDDVTSGQERARGRRILVPAGDTLCGADIALVLLDATIDDVRPMTVRATGAAQGDHLRTVGYEKLAPPAVSVARLARVVRDHVHVLETNAEELVLTESACERALGGPAMDESTGEVVGVSSRPGTPGCEGHEVSALYTRADAFFPLIAEALAQGSAPARGAARPRTKKGAIDMGATCARGADCAAGVCLTMNDRQYCSRSCDPHDRCPARFRCRKSQETAWVCAQP